MEGADAAKEGTALGLWDHRLAVCQNLLVPNSPHAVGTNCVHEADLVIEWEPAGQRVGSKP